MGSYVLLNPYWYRFHCMDCDMPCCETILNINNLNEVTNPYERKALRYIGGIPEGGISYTRCRRYNMIYMNPGLTQEGQAAFFDSMYQSGVGTFDESWRKKLERNRLQRISRFVSPPGRLLDIGCGTGTFPEVASQSGWEAWGFEISQKGFELSKIRLKGRAISGTLKDIQDAWADCITLFSVVEHNMNPLGILEEAVRICRPGGWIVFNVPNANSMETFVSLTLHLNWVGFNVSHSWYWTSQAVRAMATKVGLIPHRIESCLPLYRWGFAWEREVDLKDNPSSNFEKSIYSHLAEMLHPHYWQRLRLLLNTPFDITFLGSWFCLGGYLFIYAQRSNDPGKR